MNTEKLKQSLLKEMADIEQEIKDIEDEVVSGYVVYFNIPYVGDHYLSYSNEMEFSSKIDNIVFFDNEQKALDVLKSCQYRYTYELKVKYKSISKCETKYLENRYKTIKTILENL